MPDSDKYDKSSEVDVTVETEKVVLKRTLGLIGASSIVIGQIIGSGIFISPKGVLQNTGSVGLCLLIWVLAGIVELGNALCFAELGSSLPVSGGIYSYVRLGLGNACAFIYAMHVIFVRAPGSMVIFLMTFSKYLITLLPTCGSPQMLEKLISATAVVTIVMINAYSSRLATSFAIVTTVAKLSALVVIIIGGIVYMCKGYTSELETGFDGTLTEPTSLALAMYSAMWAYSGSENLNMVVEEVKNPAKTVPKAIIMSVLVVIVVYALTNVAYFSIMTRTELLAAEAVAKVFGDRVLGVARQIIPVAVMISTVGAANNRVFATTRITFAAARDRNIPDVLSYINVHQFTPFSAMVLSVIMALVMLFPTDVATLINLIGFLNSLFMAACIVSLLIFRLKTMKDLERPIKIPLIIPMVMVLVHTYLFIAPLAIDPQLEYVYVAVGVLGGSLLLYIPFVHFKLNVPFYDKIVSSIQLILLVCPPSKN